MRPINDPLAAVLAATRPVLLDFDGPVSPIFAGDKNRASANELRRVLAERSIAVPASVAETRDPLAVLRYAGQHSDTPTLAVVEGTLREAELRLAADAAMTDGADDFLRACAEVRRPVAIVSNNAAEAIDTFLSRFELRRYARHVVGRPHARPGRMKPHPAIVHEALALLDVEPHRCVLVGDSITDVQVAHLTGVRSIGYVKAPDRLAGLQDAGPDATVDSMVKLAAAIRAVPALPN